MQRLSEIFVLQFRIFPQPFCSIRIEGRDFDNATDRQPQAPDTRLSVHLRGIDGYTVKALHNFAKLAHVASARKVSMCAQLETSCFNGPV